MEGNQSQNLSDEQLSDIKSQITGILEQQVEERRRRDLRERGLAFVKPLKFANFIVEQPLIIITIAFLVASIAAGIDAAIFQMDHAGGLEYFIQTAVNTGRLYAYWAAVADAQEDGENAKVKTQEIDRFQIISLFKTRDGSDILQPQYLPFIKEVNDKIVHANYDEYFRLCLSDTNSFPNCSSMAVMDPLIEGLSGNASIADVTQQSIDDLVNASIGTSSGQLYVHFGSSFAESVPRKSQYYRAIFVEYIPSIVCIVFVNFRVLSVFIEIWITISRHQRNDVLISEQRR